MNLVVWRACGVKTCLLGRDKQNQKRKTQHEIEVLGCILLTIVDWRTLTPSLGVGQGGTWFWSEGGAYYYIRENTLPHLWLWGGCPEKLGLGELGGLAKWRVEQKGRMYFYQGG